MAIGVSYNKKRDSVTVESDEASGFSDVSTILKNNMLKHVMKTHDIEYVEGNSRSDIEDEVNKIYKEKTGNSNGPVRFYW